MVNAEREVKKNPWKFQGFFGVGYFLQADYFGAKDGTPGRIGGSCGV